MSAPGLTLTIANMAKAELTQAAIVNAASSADYLLGLKAPPKDEASLLMLVDAAKGVRLARLELEKRLAKITDPLKEALDAVRDEAKPQLQRFKAAEDAAKKLKTLYDAALAEKRAIQQESAQRQADAFAASNDTPAVSVFTPPPPNKVSGGIGGMHSRKVPRARITNLKLAMEAHPNLFKLDEQATLAALKVAPLIGIELYYETTQVLS